MKDMRSVEQNAELVERLTIEYKAEGIDTFVTEWTGSRVPKTVTFPNGLEKTVNHMRDGVLIFSDETTALYTRLQDVMPTSLPQSALIAYSPSMHQKPIQG